MLAPHDLHDLILPIFAGVGEQPLWQTFLTALLRRTAATQVALFARTANMAPGAHLHRAVGREAGTATLSLEQFATLGLLQQNALRPGRVYALEELLGPGTHDRRAALARRGIAYGRFLHAVTREDNHVWLVLAHERSDFSASDSALLSNLGAPLALALTLLARAEAWQLRAEIAEETLARIGIVQTPLWDDGRGGTAPVKARGLTRRIDVTSTTLPASANAVRIARHPASPDRRAAIEAIAAELGISLREAALAEAMSRGRSIVEAGADLQLTPETARNYTRRIYAKTGLTGQADLVRRVLTGLAPLA